jgi:uncharacterized protein YbaR (Trm112 family)
VFFELTDLLTCPRCGPGHGLVLLVKEVEERRVRNGWLGCPNCRHDYPVVDCIADLRVGTEAENATRPAFADEELPLKILALSGLAEERGYLLLGERLAHAASAIANIAPELEVIVVAGAIQGLVGRSGVSAVLCDAGFPVAERQVGCVAIAPGGDGGLVADAARRVSADGRLLLFDATEDDIEEAKRSGFSVLAAESNTAVAKRKTGSLPVVG